MNIYINEHRISLNQIQKNYITEKIEHVCKYLGRMSNNEASEAKVTIVQEDTKAVEDRFICEVMLILPHKHTLRCDTRALTPEAAIDTCVEKLKKQAEKLRTKLMS